MVDAREYHERTNHTPRRLREESFRLDRTNKPTPSKRYVDLPRVAPDGEPEPPEFPALTAIDTADPTLATDIVPGPSEPDLHTLAHYATGVTKELEIRGTPTAFRAAACTGKLYHIDLYFVAGDCGPDGPGIYHFDSESGGFDVLRTGDYRGVLASASGGYDAVADASVTVVATSQWWRNAWKYRERTYRHAFWDSGTILANLLATAQGAGHRAEVVTGFADDPVCALLGLDTDEEAPLELVAVGRGDPVPADAVGDPDALDAIDPEEAPLSSDPVAYPLVPDAWRQSRLADGAAARAWRDRFAAESADTSLGARAPPDAAGDEIAPNSGERIDLDPVDRETASARPVGATIERRGSCREYSHESISARKFATVLDRALGGVPVDAFAGRDLRGLVDCYCLVHAVDGIESGVYEYHPGYASLEWVRETDRETAGELALGQPVVGDAAVNVYLVADVDAVVTHFGNRGYRLAQLEAGIDLGRLYLATYAHLGLGGRGFTFFDEAVSEYFSPHADGQSPMTLFAFGVPAE